MNTIKDWAEWYQQRKVWVFPYNTQEESWSFWKNKNDKDYFNISKTWHWNEALGLRLVVGKKGVRVIEVSNKRLLFQTLKLLGLPKDYPWVIYSSAGYGIVVDTPNVSKRVFGLTNRGYKKVLLLWEGYYVLPTTDIARYFYENRVPQGHPAQISDDLYLDCVESLTK